MRYLGIFEFTNFYQRFIQGFWKIATLFTLVLKTMLRELTTIISQVKNKILSININDNKFEKQKKVGCQTKSDFS